MKRVLLFLISMNFLANSRAQINYSQGPNVYTCRNGVVETLVPNRELNSQELANLDYMLFNPAGQYYFLNISQSDIISGPSAYYNCHSYAWHLEEGNSNHVWIERGINDSNLEKYWDVNVGCFFETTEESLADKIYYYTGDHSAVKSSIQGKYESKWGKSYVIRHSPEQVPYPSTSNRRYYVRYPTISGPSTLCASGGSFSLSNLPTGATITWGCSPNITLHLAQGDTCVFKANTNGTGTISATITYQGSTFTVQKEGISVGLRATMSGPTQVSAGSSGTWSANASCGFTPYQYAWYLKKQGTLGSPSLVGNGSSLTLWAIPANPRDGEPILEVEGDDIRGGINKVYYDLYVTVRDSHGAEYTPATKTVSVPKNYILSLGYERGDDEEDASDDSPESAGATLTLSPNPAGEYVDVRIDFGNADNEPSSYVMEILNTSSYPVRNAMLSGGYNRVSVQGLQRGYYVVRIRYGDTVLTKPLMVE